MHFCPLPFCWVVIHVMLGYTSNVRLRTSEVRIPNIQQSGSRETAPNFKWVAVFSRILSISRKRCQRGPMFLLITNRKSHMRFRWYHNQLPWMTSSSHNAFSFKIITLGPTGTGREWKGKVRGKGRGRRKGKERQCP